MRLFFLVLWRFKDALYIFAAVLCLLFAILQVIGGDPTLSLVGKNADPQMIESLKSQLGLNQSVMNQFYIFMTDAITFDWGYSWVSQRSVAGLLREGFAPSLMILTASLATSFVTAYLLSLISLHFRDQSLDLVLRFSISLLMSFHFIVIVLAMQKIFAYNLNWFPVYGWEKGWEGLRYAFLPFLIHSIGSFSPKFITLRSLLVSEIDKNYVRTALSKGASWPRVYLSHITLNLVPAFIALVTAQLPAVLTGSLLLEIFFGIPGLGLLLLNSIQASDFPVIKALSVIGAGFYILCVFAGDVLTYWYVPQRGDS